MIEIDREFVDELIKAVKDFGEQNEHGSDEVVIAGLAVTVYQRRRTEKKSRTTKQKTHSDAWLTRKDSAWGVRIHDFNYNQFQGWAKTMTVINDAAKARLKREWFYRAVATFSIQSKTISVEGDIEQFQHEMALIRMFLPVFIEDRLSEVQD